MVRDLVCGVSLEIGDAVCANYHGTPYYFCSHDCKVIFEDRPEEYIQPHTTHAIDDITYPLNNLVAMIRQGANDH